jgi:hypothetical protein
MMSFTLTATYLRSLFLASFLSFLVPLAVVGSAIAVFLLIGLLPGFGFSQAIAAQILSFLATFGNGNAWEGVIVIGCACALVGAMFDTYIFTVTTTGEAVDRASQANK